MISHQFKITGFMALFLVWAGTLASAQTNVALVIGNSAYQRPLPTSIADASAMAETMRGAGFDVTELRDIHRRDGGEIMNNFLNKIAGAEGKVTAFFYYTGYAAQVAGDDYLSQSMLRSLKLMTSAPSRFGSANSSSNLPGFRRPRASSCWTLPTSTASAGAPQ